MPFIILDRDGVINYDSEEYIKSPAEWRAIPGSLKAIAELNRNGYQVFIATNQSGIARGYYDSKTLALIHKKLISELAIFGGQIQEIFYCPHHPDDECNCRKPRPGLLHQIKDKYAIELSETFFVGDSLSDVQAAKAAGCLPLLVLTGKIESSQKEHPELFNVPSFNDLAQAVDYVLCGPKKSNA